MRNYSFKQEMIIALLCCILLALGIVRRLSFAKVLFEPSKCLEHKNANKVITSRISETKVPTSQTLQSGGISLLVITFTNIASTSISAQSLFISNGYMVQSISCLKSLVTSAANLFWIQKPSATAF
jgi:hypothetical protein